MFLKRSSRENYDYFNITSFMHLLNQPTNESRLAAMKDFF